MFEARVHRSLGLLQERSDVKGCGFSRTASEAESMRLYSLLKNSRFVSGYRFSDTASLEIRCPFRGRALEFDFFSKQFIRLREGLFLGKRLSALEGVN